MNKINKLAFLFGCFLFVFTACQEPQEKPLGDAKTSESLNAYAMSEVSTDELVELRKGLRTNDKEASIKLAKIYIARKMKKEYEEAGEAQRLDMLGGVISQLRSKELDQDLDAIAEETVGFKGKETNTFKEDKPRALTISAKEGIPFMDGKMGDDGWENLPWYPIDQFWIGEPVDEIDFNGRYKVRWNFQYLYVLVEITDQLLHDTHEDELVDYWEDDCLEIFIDPNHSGGDHQYNHNAFAYHISLANKAIDIGLDKKARVYDHVNTWVSQKGHTRTYELAISLFNEKHQDGTLTGSTVLKKGQKIGFMVAYNDSDESNKRENMIGSVPIAGEDKNQGWINADVFGTLILE